MRLAEEEINHINRLEKRMEKQLYLEIPSEINNLQLPDPELLMYYKNLEKRHFCGLTSQSTMEF